LVGTTSGLYVEKTFVQLKIENAINGVQKGIK
jgi:hypothetical protein